MFKKSFKPPKFYGVSDSSFLVKVTDGEKVKFSRVSKDVAYPDVGSPENFTLDAQLKAGVVLKEENSLLLQPSEGVINESLSNFVEDYDNAQLEKSLNE